MATFLWKPVSDGGLNPGGTSVVLLGGGGAQSAAVYTADGQLVENLTRSSGSEVGQKFYSRRTGAAFGDNLVVRITYPGGKTEEYQIPSGGQRYEGPVGDSNPGPSSKGSGGGGGGGPTGGPFGFVPENLLSQFPSAVTTNYDPITAAPYNFVDPIEFGKKFGNFQRGELRKNFAQSKQFALDAIDTEFQALASYVPRSAKLKADVIAADNVFNQQQRTQQLQSAVPDVLQDQETVAANAREYAAGRVPDEITDRALELGNRSAATDLATAQGFGVKSGASQKLENLMAAKDRIQLQQYGNQLLTQSGQDRAQLRLAPTEYNNAGSQINVNPSLSGSQLQQQNFSEINQQSLIPAPTALQNKTQQEQFVTSLEDSIRKFNATNTLQNDQFNATNLNNFALNKFAYQVGYANSQAAASQTNAQTQLALQQQQDALKTFQDFLTQAQKQGTNSSIAQGLGQLLSAVKNIISLFQGDGKDTVSGGTGGSSDKTGGGGTSKPGAKPGNTVTREPTTPKKPVEPQNPDFDNPPVETPPADDAEPVPPPDESDTVEEADVEVEASPLPPKDFERAAATTGDPGLQGFQSLSSRSVTKRDVDVSQKMFENLDLSTEPKEGYAPAGYNQAGQAVYQRIKADPNNFREGATEATSIERILEPLNVFKDPLDKQNFQKIINTASDVQNLYTLSQFVKNKDAKGFINHLIKNTAPGVAKALIKDPKDAAGVDAALKAYTLFQNWDNLDAAGKGLGIARLGISAYKFRTGEDLGQRIVAGPTTKGTSPDAQLTVGEALNLVAAGYNVYGLVKNWDQYNTFEKIINGTNTALQVAQTTKTIPNLLGYGATNSAVPGITSSALAANGLTPVASQGIGAVAGTATSTVPAGYTVVSKAADGSFVAMPSANAASYAGKTGVGGGSAATPTGPGPVQQALAGVAIAAGTYAVYQNWGAGGAKGAANGALGGASIASGMYTLGATNPYLLGAVVAFSALGGGIKTGKSEEQMGRDSQRKWAQKIEIADKDYQITLADGSKADIGKDGSNRLGGFANRDRLVGEHKNLKERHMYDVDYTNDLDYATSMGASALVRLGQGGKSERADQLAGQLTNALLSNIGEGKPMSQENFSKAMANLRAQFSKMGIKDKQSGYALANQAFAEERLNDMDVVTIHQALNMMYDQNGYETAQKLMQGRFRGIEVAQGGKNPGDTVDVDKVNAKPPARIPALPTQKPPVKNPADVKPGESFSKPNDPNIYTKLPNGQIVGTLIGSLPPNQQGVLPGVRPGERPTFPVKTNALPAAFYNRG